MNFVQIVNIAFHMQRIRGKTPPARYLFDGKYTTPTARNIL